MNPSLYRSAMEGKVADLGQHKDVLDGELTPNHNTVLHVAAQFGHLDYVKEVLETCPSLLRRRNIKGETPLHTAAREGHAEIVKAMKVRGKSLEEELESGLVGAVKEMLRATNLDGDTALHMAARYCHLEGEKYLKLYKLLTKELERGQGKKVAVRIIMRTTKLDREEVEEIMRGIEEVEEIMRADNEVDRDTAVHMAARNRLEKENRDTYLEVVKLLSQEDAEFQHPPNKFQETPLYLAAERGIMGVAIVDTLVETYESLLTYSGPGGRTALHAAALKDFTGQSTKKLLEWKKDLINQADGYGWIPLHYAASNRNAKGVEELLAKDQSVVYITTANKDDQDAAATSNGNENGVRELLVMDESGAYITTTNKDGLDTALHIAAAQGHVNVMKKLLSYNPDCWEMVNSKGQNVLHIAVDMNRDLVIDFILGKSWVGQLINQKDNEGNTPVHLLIASDCDGGYGGGLWWHHRADHHAFNGKNMTPVDLVWSNLMEERMSNFAARYIVDDTFLDSGIKASGGRNLACNAHVNLAKLEKARRHEKQKRREAKREKAEAKRKGKEKALENSVRVFQTFVIVAALIATITFAAAFTIPGGYDGNKGRDKGMAILARESAFKAFVITNTIAMVCSVTSIFMCLIALGYSVQATNIADFHYVTTCYDRAIYIFIVSMFCLMIAFIAATFAVLAHAIALAVSTCIIVCFACIGFIVEMGKFNAQFHFVKLSSLSSLCRQFV